MKTGSLCDNQISHYCFSSDFKPCFMLATTTTRGHEFKLFSRLKCRGEYCFNRVLNDWNSLPNYIVINAESVNGFKSMF